MFLQLSNEPFHNRKKILRWGEKKKQKTKQQKKKTTTTTLL